MFKLFKIHLSNRHYFTRFAIGPTVLLETERVSSFAVARVLAIEAIEQINRGH